MMQRRRFTSGFSLIELMVGLALGLFVVGAAGGLLVAQLREHRALALDARLTQDLRSALGLIARDLRRAGYWGHAGAAGTNPYTALALSGSADAGALALSYSMDSTENDTLDTNEQFGFRLRSGAVELQLGNGNWQAVTDASTVTVTTLRITPALLDTPLAALCPSACGADGSCAPHQQQRAFAIALAARLAGNASVSRSVQETVRVRSDVISGSCNNNGSGSS